MNLTQEMSPNFGVPWPNYVTMPNVGLQNLRNNTRIAGQIIFLTVCIN